MTSGLASRLGIEVTETSAARVVATMAVTPDHHQPFGYLHGGASVVLAETVASIGGHFAAAEGKTAFGMEINANHLRPIREGTLTAEAVPLHVGRTSQVWTVEIRDAQKRLVCIGRCTLAVVSQP
ncbi:MAG: hotdog fold thioesterase [Rhodothermales bacterium]